jgi:hypothetical protein
MYSLNDTFPVVSGIRREGLIMIIMRLSIGYSIPTTAIFTRPPFATEHGKPAMLHIESKNATHARWHGPVRSRSRSYMELGVKNAGDGARGKRLVIDRVRRTCSVLYRPRSHSEIDIRLSWCVPHVLALRTARLDAGTALMSGPHPV